MQSFNHSIFARSLALLLVATTLSLGCEVVPVLEPISGRIQYQEAGLIAVPGGFVNAAGGNLLIERVDLSVDTLLGTWEIRASYNSRAERWLWSFQVTYDGSTFVDASDAAHAVGDIADGAAIPGTIWRVGDSDTILTKGGLAYDFDVAGRLAAVHWETLDYPRIRHTWTEGLLEIAQCSAVDVCLPIYWVALDEQAQPTSATDLRALRTAEFTYDVAGRLVVARNAQDVESGNPGFRYEYGYINALLISATDSAGDRVVYRYAQGSMIRGVDQIGEPTSTHEFRYYRKNPEGLFRTVHINPLGGTTRFLLDDDRRLHRIERDATGETHVILWGPPGLLRPTGEIAASGAETSYAFDGDELVGVVQPSGNAVAIEYEAGGLNTHDVRAAAVRRVSDTLGLVQERSYDSQGRLDSISNGEGEVTTMTYGPATLASVTEPFGATRSYTRYGSHGHWLVVEGSVEAKRSFDPVGNLQVPSVFRRGGGELLRSHDSNRALIAVDVAATAAGSVVESGEVILERRADGNVDAVRRPRGADHEFVRDSLGRVTQIRERVDGAWWATSFEYDLAGNVTARTRPNGMREELEYDVYGRLVRRRALRDGIAEGEVTFTRFAGNLVAVDDSTRGATEGIGYDGAGRQALRVFPDGESIAWVYDLRSRIVAEIYSLPGVGAVRAITIEYDLANRPLRVSADGEGLIERTFADGQLVEIRSGNGLVRSFAYSPDTGSLSGATTVDAAGEWVETTAVERTLESAPVRHQIRSSTETQLGLTEEQYWLGVWGSLQDPDKLVGKRVFGWNDGNGSSRSYAWDELSNPVDDSDGDVFDYNDEGNRLLRADLAGAAGVTDYVYDEAGFAISRAGVPIGWTATGRMATHGPIELAWDLQDRLRSVTVGGATRDFSRFGGRVESDPATGAPIALDLGTVSLEFAGNDRLYRYFDFRGNVSFVSDENGDVVNHYRYHPFGVDAVLGNGANAATFVGRGEIGPLMLLGARMYDPAVGRFLSPDPIFSLFSQYAYALGNPLWFSDPDGQQFGAIETGFDAGELRSMLEGAAGALTVAVMLTGTAAVAPEVFGGLAILMLMVLIAEAVSGAVSAAASKDASAGKFTGSLAPALSPAFGRVIAPDALGSLAFTCSPLALSSAERPNWLLGWILLLQVSLGMRLRRRWRRVPREETR